MKSSLILEGKAQAEQTLSYFYLPFDLPENVVRFDVAYEYSDGIGSDPQLTGGNTVDIGIFDPRGTAFMTEGFRGWSGSARSEFFIALDEATPGYMAGAIQAGQWNIVLGFYKVAPIGCDYRVTIEYQTEENAKTGEFPVLLPLSAKPRESRSSHWYKGELHCHTYHSDGDSDPLDIIRLAELLGLDFLAITDHNVISHQARMNQLDTKLMLIPGMEVTTYKGHWNIWGDYGWIDFRLLNEAEMQAAIKEAVSCGYLVSCNHPRPYGPAWTFENVEDFHCVEVWNGPWEALNDVCIEFWEAKLKRGKIYPAVGGSDSHFHKRSHAAQLGQPTTHIYCPEAPSPAALLNSLKQGHTFISDSPNGPELYLYSGNAMMGDTIPKTELAEISLECKKADDLVLEIVTANGIIMELPAEEKHSLSVEIAGSPYLRAQLRESNSRKIRALTNPIYFK